MAIVNPALANILAAQQTAGIVPTEAGVPIAPAPVVPIAGGPSPMPAMAPIVDPAAGILEEAPTILGLTPQQFAAIAGGIGQALAPPDTWQSRLGAFAKSIGQGKIVGGLTGEDIEGSKLTPKTTAKKSKLEKPIADKIDLSNTLLGA